MRGITITPTALCDMPGFRVNVRKLYLADKDRVRVRARVRVRVPVRVGVGGRVRVGVRFRVVTL